MRRLETKKCNMILTEKHKKYLNYHLEKLINVNRGEKMVSLDQRRVID